MIKSILKEIIIILLLCVAILFILSILFYDYNPINKVVPNKIAYSVPANIRNELEEESVQESLDIENKVYKVEGADLNIYKKSNSYNPSKENPFASTINSGSSNTTGNNGTVKVPDTNNGNGEQNSNTNEQANNTSPTNNPNSNMQNNKPSGLK